MPSLRGTTARQVRGGKDKALAVHRYDCSLANVARAEMRCISFGGIDVDHRIVELVLQVVQPGAIEATERVVREQTTRRDEFIEALVLELKLARYEANRAQRQYDVSVR